MKVKTYLNSNLFVRRLILNVSLDVKEVYDVTKTITGK